MSAFHRDICSLRQLRGTTQFPVINLGIVVVLVAFGAGYSTQASAMSRHCRAAYEWETTGKSIKQKFSSGFEAKGECGSTVPNRCRIRARNAVERCVSVNVEKRWDYVGNNSIPEACVANSSDSTVQGYDLTLRCSRRTTDPKSQCYYYSQLPPTQSTTELLAGRGDIKSRLEGEVCCVYKNGNYKYPNNKEVHVNLMYSSWGDDYCSGHNTLMYDYEIDCQSFRKNHCHHENDWD